MVTVSVPIIARNIVKLRYPLDKVVYSVLGFADEVILLVDPTSEDDTIDYVYDIEYEVNKIRKDVHTVVEVEESVWDFNNISNGSEFAVQTNKSIDLCNGDWILVLQADEAIHENDFDYLHGIMEESSALDIDAFSMTRLYFFGNIKTIRRDWTVPITRLFRKGARRSSGDTMNTEGSEKVAMCDAEIYHYSRIGDPEIISKRIRTLDGFFHPKDILLSEDELSPYAFDTYNFDCMAKDGITVGRKKVNDRDLLVSFYGTHPSPFVNYKGEIY